MHQKVVGSIPGQGTYLGYRFGPQLGCVWETIYGCFSLTLMSLSVSVSLFLSPFLSLKNQ